MSLSKAEQEVIISFTAEDERAEVYTSNPVYIRRLEKLAKKRPDVYKRTNTTHSGADQSVTSVSFECPVNMIRFGMPSRERTQEEKEQSRERMKELNRRKNQEETPDIRT